MTWARKGGDFTRGLLIIALLLTGCAENQPVAGPDGAVVSGRSGQVAAPTATSTLMVALQVLQHTPWTPGPDGYPEKTIVFSVTVPCAGEDIAKQYGFASPRTGHTVLPTRTDVEVSGAWVEMPDQYLAPKDTPVKVRLYYDVGSSYGEPSKLAIDGKPGESPSCGAAWPSVDLPAPR